MGDWDGDGRDTVGVVRGSRWLLRSRLGGGTADRRVRYGDRADVKAVRGGAAGHGSVWDRLASCESGRRWSLDSTYDGGLQFHPTTWRRNRYPGYPGYAHDARRERQIAVARRILRGDGWDAWPHCSHELGLR